MPQSTYHCRASRVVGVWLALVGCFFGPAEAASWDAASRAENDRESRPANDTAHEAVLRYRALEGNPSPTELRLFADAADGRWDEHGLLRAALLASGVDRPDRLDSYEAGLCRLVAELRESDTTAGTPRQQAQWVFEFMHRRILRGGYRLEATALTEALDRGQFNCVSASVLFHCLAREFGLPVCAMEGPGHAMTRLRLAGEIVDVETTCPEWFRLAADLRKQAERARKIPARTAEVDRRARPLREVSDVQLVAMIYYNRGVDLLGEKRFPEALAANAKALRLDPSSVTARANLLATLNNWAIDLGLGRQYAEAARLLEKGIALEPDYAIFQANYRQVHRNWVESLRPDLTGRDR